MRRCTLSMILLCSLLSLFSLAYTPLLRAGEAGVGVINVPPKYGYIRVEQQDELIRVYLTISDYNSWGDIDEINVTIDSNGVPVASFLFQQFEDNTSYIELDKFSETPASSHLLQTSKCLYQKSNKSETVDDRCDLEVRFVFQKTLFTGLHVSIYDREGTAPAEAYIHYSTGETMRADNIIVIPFIGAMAVPPFLVDIIALTTAAAGTIYYFDSKGYLRKKKTPL
jgi:hypothetical protein